MTIFSPISAAIRWLRALYPWIVRDSTKRPGRGLRCEDCRARIHKHDKYTVLAARHKDCRDPQLAGQQSLPLKPATLTYFDHDGEPVTTGPQVVMGMEFMGEPKQ